MNLTLPDTDYEHINQCGYTTSNFDIEAKRRLEFSEHLNKPQTKPSCWKTYLSEEEVLLGQHIDYYA